MGNSLIQENCVWVINSVIVLLGFCLLRAFSKNRLVIGDYVVALWYLLAAAVHCTFNSYLLYGPRISPSAGAKPKIDDVKDWFMASVQKGWRDLSEVDKRISMDEFQPLMMAMSYGLGIIATAFSFIVFLGYLLGAKWTHPMQIVAGMWHLGLGFAYAMPEHFASYPHITSPLTFWLICGVFMWFGTLFVLSSICRLSCGFRGSVCSISGDKYKEETVKEKSSYVSPQK